MNREILPTTLAPGCEPFEFDRALWSEEPADQPLRTEDGWIDVCRSLGQLALEATIPELNGRTINRRYRRGNDRLSADDIRELESYFGFLRHHYGIPEGATIFPKRDTEPAAPTRLHEAVPAHGDPANVDPEDDHAA